MFGLLCSTLLKSLKLAEVASYIHGFMLVLVVSSSILHSEGSKAASEGIWRIAFIDWCVGGGTYTGEEIFLDISKQKISR